MFGYRKVLKLCLTLKKENREKKIERKKSKNKFKVNKLFLRNHLI